MGVFHFIFARGSRGGPGPRARVAKFLTVFSQIWHHHQALHLHGLSSHFRMSSGRFIVAGDAGPEALAVLLACANKGQPSVYAGAYEPISR